MNRSLFALALLAPLFVFACDKSAADAQREADKAQAEANREIAQTTSESTTKITSAQVEADKKIAAAEQSFAKNREDFRHDVQTKIDSLDKKLAVLDAKAKKSVGKKKTTLDTNLSALHSRRDGFVRDFKSIEGETALTWDATKARLEKQWSDLKDSVDKVD